MPFLEAPPTPLERVARLLKGRAGGGPGPAVPKGRAGGTRPPAVVVSTRGSAAGLRDESLDKSADRILAQIERLERSKARLEAGLVDAYAALHTVEAQQLARLTSPSPVPLSAEQVVTQEITCATGVGVVEVSRRLELALAPRRHRVLREGLRAGAVSLYRALQVVAETRALDDRVLPDLETTVLATAPDGTVSSQRLFMTRLRRCVRSGDHRSEDERRCAAGRRRTAHGRLTEDGMGTFTVVASAERVVGVLDRIDALARSARAAGDERTLDQLRSDLLCDLALFGSVPRGGSESTALSGALASTGGSWLASAPPASVRIVVPFEVAAGLSDAACEIPGHGWVTAAHARQIITAPGSVWQRLAVDVESGRTLELSTGRYAPTREMVEHVRAVDGVCRAPGCQAPAERCDLDHLVPWPQGNTHVSNLQSLSRSCHNPKTVGAWTAERVVDDGVRWTSLAGRDYVTYPKDWREALRDPGAGPPGDSTPAAVAEVASDPPPF